MPKVSRQWSQRTPQPSQYSRSLARWRMKRWAKVSSKARLK